MVLCFLTVVFERHDCYYAELSVYALIVVRRCVLNIVFESFGCNLAALFDCGI